MANFLTRALSGALGFLKSLVKKHQDTVKDLAERLLPLVAEAALRSDLSGQEKRELVLGTIKTEAEKTGKQIAESVLNEALEAAVNQAQLASGKLTEEQLNATKAAVNELAEVALNKLTSK